LRQEFRAELAARQVAPDLCFPMAVGASWGPVPPPDEDFTWNVKSLNGDPFGVKGGETFHLSAYEGSGKTGDVWFLHGVGILQEVHEHHGTYFEIRSRLLSATIDGRLRTYQVRPARTVPLDPGECQAGWRHFVRGDGTLIRDAAGCRVYARATTLRYR